MEPVGVVTGQGAILLGLNDDLESEKVWLSGSHRCFGM